MVVKMLYERNTMISRSVASKCICCGGFLFAWSFCFLVLGFGFCVLSRVKNNYERSLWQEIPEIHAKCSASPAEGGHQEQESKRC